MEPPKAAIKAFDTQRRGAKRRGIPFLLSFAEWWDWWQTDNRWAKRGHRAGNLVMARFGDVGPYADGNIYCSDAVENWAAARRKPEVIAKSVATRRLRGVLVGEHLKNRATHPRCRPVVSPTGAFPSIVLAAEANGIKPKYAQQLASRAAKGWRYA